MESGPKLLAFWGIVFCGVARAQFVTEFKEPQRSGRKLTFYLGAVYVYDTNVYIDEDAPESDQVVRGLASLNYESEATDSFLRIGAEYIYPYYLESSDLIDHQYRGLLMYDRSFAWGKILLSDDFRRVSDPVDTQDVGAGVPYKGKIVRMSNRLDPRLRLKFGAVELEGSWVWEFNRYSPSQVDFLDYDDQSLHAEGIFAVGSKSEVFAHFGTGKMDYAQPTGAVDCSHTRIYGGLRGEPSPKLAYEVAGGMLNLTPQGYETVSDYYVRLRATWEPTPGINRLLFCYRRDIRPTGIVPYAFGNKSELSYAHWIATKLHAEAGGSYETGETAGGGEDWQTTAAFAGLRYEMRSFRYLFVRYEYRARDSKMAGASYTDTRFMGGMVYRF